MPGYCTFNTCRKQPTYGINNIREKCSEHKLEGMKRIPPYKCNEPGCEKGASFNFYGEKKRLYCSKHKRSNMICLGKKCAEENCNLNPTFGNTTLKKREYCSLHKKEGMILLHKKKVCLEENCKRFPVFNYNDKTTGLYCSLHKLENMIDVVNKRCEQQDCISITPCFNYPNKTSGRFCVIHALEGMINVKCKKCVHPNCIIQPTYNYKGETTGLYCKNHKLEGMEDIKHPKCEKCDTRPTYNYEGRQQAHYCKVHKLEGMVNIISSKCIEENCKKIAIYNMPGNKPMYCSNHAKEDMVNVSDPRCKTEGCDTFICNKYDGYCLRCFVYLYPDNPKSLNYKVKEKHMVDFIKTNFSNEIIITDKMVYGGCSKRRPDVYIDKYTHVIIVECDENQHNNYDTTCENKRTMELFKDFGNRPIILIRFNPDNYIKSDGTRIKGCFNYHKFYNIPLEPISIEWTNRTNTLKLTIKKHLHTIPNREVTTDYLFYDE